MEKLIQGARADAIYLKKAIKGDNKEISIHLLEQLDLKLHRMEAFNFNVERRDITVEGKSVQDMDNVDKTIKKLCSQIEAGNPMTGQEISTVNALAKLILARAFANYSSKFCAGLSPIKES